MEYVPIKKQTGKLERNRRNTVKWHFAKTAFGSVLNKLPLEKLLNFGHKKSSPFELLLR